MERDLFFSNSARVEDFARVAGDPFVELSAHIKDSLTE